jgi:class 3 adenylate cyclase
MDVGGWLRSIGLGQYEVVFRESEIDAEVLPDLTENDLSQLGVPLGHRKRLIKAIANLSVGGGATAALVPVTTRAYGDEAERRQLTVMFCDLVGSTAISTRLDPEDLRGVIGAYHRCCTECIERNGGFVAKYIGDGVLAYFGYPQAHEDDAERAVRAGLTLVDAAPKLVTAAGSPLRVRVGIATGLVIVGDLIGTGAAQEQAVVGDTPNLAARLQAIAEPGAVVIAASTHRLTGGLFEYRDLGAVALKGFPQEIGVWQAIGEGAAEGRFDALRVTTTPLIGRDEELGLLLRRWEQAKSGDGCVVLVAGEPGIGKSRLAEALVERLGTDQHTRLRYFCSPHHQNSALYPSLTQLERAAGFRREDTAEQRLAKLEAILAEATSDFHEIIPLFADLLSIPTGDRYPPLDLKPQKRKERTLQAQVAQVVGLAARQPVLMEFEDIHWSDATTREALDLLIDRAPTLRLLVIITYRPEFSPPWIGRSHVSLLNLNRLPPRRRAEMIAHVAGGVRLPKEIVDHIVERTDGVPLFVEELTKAVIESGILNRSGDDLAASRTLALQAIPTTLQASLLARLDRLSATREVVQIAAALGRQFSYELISAAARVYQGQLDAALAQLVSAELMLQRGSPPDAEYTFKHALVQDAAYSTLLRGPRQLIHERIVVALESRFPEIVEAQPERLAHHCSEAGQIEKAAVYALAAGRQALSRSAMQEAISQTQKGIELVSQLPISIGQQEQELELQLLLGDALQTTRGYAAPEAGEAFTRAKDLCVLIGRPAQLASVIWGLWEFRQHRFELELAERHAEEMRQLGLKENEGTFTFLACHMSGFNYSYLGDFLRSRAYFEEGLRNPSTVMGAFHPRVGSLLSLARMLLYLGYLDQARVRYEEGLAEARKSNPFSLATALVLGIFWFRTQGNFTPLADELLVLSDEQGFGTLSMFAAMVHGWTLAMKGQAEEGIAKISESVTSKRLFSALTVLGPLFLAEAYGSANQPAEGLASLAEAEQAPQLRAFLGGSAEIHLVRARLLLLLGASVAAEEILLQAITIAKEREAKFLELLSAIELAQLWAKQAKRAAAAELLTPIYDWFVEGLQTAVLKKAKALLDELGGAPAPIS